MHAEIGRLQELLEDADDCKWIYQRLVELSVEVRVLAGAWPPDVADAGTREWLDKLEALDPLRAGRWRDLRRRIEGVQSN